MSIAAVIFDFGGVIVPGGAEPIANETESPFVQVERRFGLPSGFAFRWLYLENPAWMRLRVGEGSFEEWYETCRRLVTEHASADAAEAFIAALTEDRPPAFNPGMIELLEQLRGRYRLGLLSNAAPGLEEDLQRKFRIAHLFDDVVNSATVRLAKPDPRVFRLAAERLGVPPESCFFTDDLAHNVEGARSVGMTAHQFRGASDLAAALRAAGVEVTDPLADTLSGR
ncbi:MAG: HAD family phosphatase [Chloroflexota bacterium]|nr:HAD family phosphatase [Dehalococcoidia bacterium]MDW8047590.1 HAD family phosphatase [Chloroflexota bacterium]